MTVLPGWTFADVWEAVADRFPDEPAQIGGGTATTWRAFDRRADGIAAALLGAGLGRQAKVAQFLYNGPEYLESVHAAFKAGLVPVNTNYRYTGGELAYLWDNADVEAVVFHGDLAAQCEEVRHRLGRVRLWLWVDVGTGPCPPWAVPYAQAAESAPGDGPTRAPWGRSGDDLLLLYTGGTTGQPKGVMWPQDTLFRMLEELNGRAPGAVADPAARAAALDRPGPRVLPAPPLMHGTALWFAIPALSQGGCVVTCPDRHFDPARLLDTVVEQQVKGLCLVGDAFGRPLADALDAEPGRWDLSGLRVLFSSGVMFADATKARLLAHAPRALVVDSLGTSESGGLGRSLTGGVDGDGGAAAATAAFTVGPTTRVVGDDGRDVVPGAGQRGRLAVSGHIPAGYYGDPDKTAETFLTLDGVVHVVAGDWAEVEADGTIRLLGRGSVCINTGGEKVYPEEVEEAVKRVAGVRDAVVVGVPDERFGEIVTAVVEPVAGATVDPAAVTSEVRRTLAGYKVPRRVVVGPIGRAPNGKADYRRLRDTAIAAALSTD
ncbi:MAG TPA: AMP-binding protein [Acidimicrobiales bacterium]|nr:AMP-binding protein [Acidimicrobiales bacterium]